MGRSPAERPNVVVIVTDDQRAETLRVMTRVRRLLGSRGATFRRSYVNFALCCPSRASLLDGRSTRTTTASSGNTPPEGGFEVFQELHGSSNLADRGSHGAGYWTALVGKYFNGYGERRSPVRPGGLGRVDRQHAARPARLRLHAQPRRAADRSRQRPRGLQGGRAQRRGGPGDRPPRAGRAAVLPDARLHRAARRGPEGKPAAAARLHRGGEASSALRARVRLGSAPDAPRIQRGERLRQASRGQEPLADRPGRTARSGAHLPLLPGVPLAVDDGVGRIVAELKRQGELADTLIVFTSDNGLFFGEHRILTGKVRHYEPASRVPLVMRGPGVRPGTRVGEPVMNVDLATNLLEAAGADPPDPLDWKRSLLPLAAGNQAPSLDLC